MAGLALHNADFFDVLPTLAPGSVDMVLCDLPYGTTQNKWDTPVPLDKMWHLLRAVCKPEAPIVLFGAQPFTSQLVCSNLPEFRYDWTWRKLGKATGHLNAKKQPLRDKEDILVFYRRPGVYNPQFTAGTPFKDKAGKDHTARTSMTGSYGAYTNKRNDNDGFRYPRQVLEFGRVERGTLHPTEKPVPLLRYLVETYSKPGDLVLDHTMGSGSTGQAALETGRRFCGVEMDPTYFERAETRLRACVFSHDHGTSPTAHPI